MNKIELEINNQAGSLIYQKVHQAPAKWDELTKDQLLLLAATMGSKLIFKDARNILAILLYKVPVRLVKHLNSLSLDDIGDTISFLFKKNTLNNWLIEAFRHRLFKYYGPKKQLSNITVDEYILTERCYEQFGNTKNAEYLDTLAAILYRPKRFSDIDNDIRRQLTAYGYIKRAKRFKSLPLRLKYAIYLNYEGCRNYIIENNKDVFTPGKSTGKQEKQSLTPWADIVSSSAPGAFGTIKETKAANLHEFLKKLGATIREAKELEEKYRT